MVGLYVYMTILYCRLYGYILRVVGGMVFCILLQWSAWIVLGSGRIVSRSLDRVGPVVSRLPGQVGPVQRVRALDRVLDRVGIRFACLDRGSRSVKKKYWKTTIFYCNSSHFMLQ